MIKYVKVTTNKTREVRPIDFSIDGVIKYIGQSGTSGYASAAKGYLADYVLRNVSVSWMPLLFDNSKNDKSYYVDALAESVIEKPYSKYDRLIVHSTPDLWESTILQYKNIKGFQLTETFRNT